jgi:histidinol-phosphate aminotransferase
MLKRYVSYVAMCLQKYNHLCSLYSYVFKKNNLKMIINQLVRKNILALKPYSSARDEFKGEASVFLDANENPFNNGLNRYPDPLALSVKALISKQKNIPVEQIFTGNGSDEVIDVLVRVFCEPRMDHIMTLPPTYGMYEVSADTADVEVKKIALNTDFQPNIHAILSNMNAHSKILFLCSPNNPTGNVIKWETIQTLAEQFSGIVAIDEAYIDFANQTSCLSILDKYPNLVVMQTFSKAWGLAGIRLGMAFASRAIIDLMNKVKPPYNVNQLTQKAAIQALTQVEKTNKKIQAILKQRAILENDFKKHPSVEKIYPSDANFLLVKTKNANDLYHFLVKNGIIVRNRSNILLCEGCLRITIGTAIENKALLKAWKLFETTPKKQSVL